MMGFWWIEMGLECGLRNKMEYGIYKQQFMIFGYIWIYLDIFGHIGNCLKMGVHAQFMAV